MPASSGMNITDTHAREKHSSLATVCVFAFGIAVIFFLIFTLKPNWELSSDNFGYYKYTRSIYFDRDLDFSNEQAWYLRAYPDLFSDANTETLFALASIHNEPTSLGRLPNPFPIGAVMLELPFVAIADGIAHVTHEPLAPGEPPGFSPTFVLALAVSGIFFGVFGLILLFFLLKELFGSSRAATIGIMGIWLASPLLYQFVSLPSFSHLFSFFADVLFVFFWVMTRKKRTMLEWCSLGFLLGFAALIRWQEWMLILIPLIESIALVVEKKSKIKEALFALLMLFSGALFAFLPQLIAWKSVYGSFFILPPSNTHLDLLRPHLFELLLGIHQGSLMHLAPWLIVALLGFPALIYKSRVLASAIAVIAIGQLWITSSLSDWQGGGLWGVFGARRLTSILFIFALCAAAYVARYPAAFFPAIAITAICACLMVLTVVELEALTFPLGAAMTWDAVIARYPAAWNILAHGVATLFGRG